ncbi:MAG TPA: hypothetical protein PLO37_21335 [Candidatus Hydrogenedentes bacterium]|nr:hypothetical protein [Candidatus Hydrogenedentota bacterium]HPG69397.1 hypothetical protein [Candidatus Hydrogenedentota bacterium]
MNLFETLGDVWEQAVDDFGGALSGWFAESPALGVLNLIFAPIMLPIYFLQLLSRTL